LFEGRDPEAVVRELMAARHPLYAGADIVVESRDIPHEAMVEEIIQALASCPLLAGPDSVPETSGAPHHE
jgi:shikimate kinase